MMCVTDGEYCEGEHTVSDCQVSCSIWQRGAGENESANSFVLTRSSLVILLEQFAHPSWSLSWSGFQVWSLRDETGRLRNGSFQLGVDVIRVVLWRDIHLDIWICSVVL